MNRPTSSDALLTEAVCACDHAAAARALAEGAKPHAQLLMRAIFDAGDAQMLQLLIDHGGPVDAIGNTPALMAVRTANRELTKVLLNGGAEPGSFAAPLMSHADTEAGAAYARWLMPQIIADETACRILIREIGRFEASHLTGCLFPLLDREDAADVAANSWVRDHYQRWLRESLGGAITSNECLASASGGSDAPPGAEPEAPSLGV